MAKKESIQNFGMGKRGREKIVECAINPFIPFIEKQGLRGGGEALARRYHDMSSSHTIKNPRSGDIFGTCSYCLFSCKFLTAPGIKLIVFLYLKNEMALSKCFCRHLC